MISIQEQTKIIYNHYLRTYILQSSEQELYRNMELLIYINDNWYKGIVKFRPFQGFTIKPLNNEFKEFRVYSGLKVRRIWFK